MHFSAVVGSLCNSKPEVHNDPTISRFQNKMQNLLTERKQVAKKKEILYLMIIA